MRGAQKFGCVLVAACLAQAAFAAGEQVTVKQGRYLMYPSTLFDTAPESNAENIDFEVVKTHTGWKKFFAELGLIYPFFQVKLSVMPGADGDAPVAETRWEFPTAYYFPADARDIEGADVLVNVWRSFPVTARVKLKDGREKTVTRWIDPEAALARR